MTELDCGAARLWDALVKTVAAAMLILVLSVATATADEPDLTELLDIGRKAVPLRDAWERCTAAVVKPKLVSDFAASAIAEQALKGCKRQQTKLRAALRRRIGPKQADTVVDQLRERYRGDLISVIDQLRPR